MHWYIPSSLFFRTSLIMRTLSWISYRFSPSDVLRSSTASLPSSVSRTLPFFSHLYLTSGIPKASQVQKRVSLSSMCLSPMEMVNTGRDWMLKVWWSIMHFNVYILVNINRRTCLGFLYLYSLVPMRRHVPMNRHASRH